MYQFFDGHSRLRVLVTLSVLAFYGTVCAAVDLFHTDRCRKGLLEPFTKEDLSEDELCPACLFKAGCHSTQPDITTPLPSAELARVWNCQPPESVYEITNEWASSIVLRGPPTVTPY